MNKNIAEELGLPIRKTRGWKKNLKTSKAEDFTPLNPVFCDHKDSTGKKCGNLLTSWNSMFYAQYQACEECTKKYHLDEGKFFPLEESKK